MREETIEMTFMPDGSVKVNSSQLGGSEQEILKELSSLTAALGGSLVVERHEPGVKHFRREAAGTVIKLGGKK